MNNGKIRIQGSYEKVKDTFSRESFDFLTNLAEADQKDENSENVEDNDTVS